MSSVIDVTLAVSTFVTLLIIQSPVSNAPIFLALTAGETKEQQKRGAWIATGTSLLIVMSFGIFGRYILSALHISTEAIQLSGGVLLFLVAMELLRDNGSNGTQPGASKVSAALVPLGTPLLGGPGAIVAVMLGVNKADGSLAKWVGVIVGVLLCHLVVWLTLRFALEISRFLGDAGITLLTKIFGVLLGAIAVQMVMDAVFAFIRTSGLVGS
ncbi:MAG: MarC family protein [Actinomycetaceae bacterium]|nr:MarC family protein [Actinomycetaceae bacterium]MDU0970183.1 MarC family protein [Actinomycetaceae bacterium]